MKEQWKPVPDYEQLYEVSSLGRVRRKVMGGGRSGTQYKAGRLLKPYPQHKGYLLVNFRDHGRNKVKALHRLVAEVFIPNPKHLPEVNHLGPKTDCRASMLEWRSSKGNVLYKQQHSGKGVSFLKRINKWVARYSPAPGQDTWIGSFKTKGEAVQARAAAVATIPHIL